MSGCHDCADCPAAQGTPFKAASATPHVVALVGPPNSGKSTLFNRLTGLRQKVANFPGVTVEHHIGRALPNCESVILDDCGHVPQYEHPEKTNGLIRDFLGSRKTPLSLVR